MGKNIVKKLREEEIGSIGIGAMIVFIAMVLVAGIAASVLVQTANKLEIQAMTTGDETRSEVATGIHVEDIEGHYDSSSGLDYLAIMISPRAGSSDVDLSETYVEISDTTTKHVLKYKASTLTLQEDINGNLFAAVDINATQFGIKVLEDADSSCTAATPVINRGDCVMIIVRCDTGRCFNSVIPERTDVWGLIQPEDGSPGVFSFRTPSSYASDVVYDLY